MTGEERSWLQRFIIWRERNIKEKRFILLLSFLVGIFTAFAALILKVLIHWIQNFLTENFDTTEANYQYLIYPVVGIFLAGLFVRYVVKDDISHGVTKILYAISRRQGRIKRHNTWSSIIASSITIGFGGSVGAEAPIVLTGSAIGSNLGSLFRMEHRTLMLLVGCGAAGAVAGIFKAPIAGLVFTLEVLMIDLTMSSLLPLLISAVTAATVSYIVTGTEAMFKFHLDQAFELERIPYVIMLGIFCGLVSLYFTRAMNSVEGLFGKLKLPYKKLLVGGSMLSILIFLFPPLYGEGYDTIELLLNGTSNVEWDTVMNNSFFYGHSQLEDALDGKVKEVKVSTRLKDHPVCLSADGPLSIEMEKVLSKQPGSEGVKSDKVLELNVNHPVFAVLKAAQEAGDTDKLKKYSALLYAQAQLIEGLPVDDPAAYAEAVCSLMK